MLHAPGVSLLRANDISCIKVLVQLIFVPDTMKCTYLLVQLVHDAKADFVRQVKEIHLFM